MNWEFPDVQDGFWKGRGIRGQIDFIHGFIWKVAVSSVQFSCSVMSDSLWPRGLQHVRPPYPLPTPVFCSPLLLPPSIFPSIRVFLNESVLLIRCPKYWSFSFSPSNWKVVAEPWKTQGVLASGGEEFNPGPVTRLDHSELLCNAVFLKYKRDKV